MSIIYEPQEIFNVKEAIGGSVVQAFLQAAVDFVAGINKPWTYYLGLLFGHAALATGIPGAAALIYVIGDSLDFWVFKSPDGSDLRLFLNGVQVTSLDTYSATSVWELVQGIALAPNQVNEVAFVNFAASTASGATGIPFMTLGEIVLNGSSPFAYDGSSITVPLVTLNLRTQDAETDSPFGVIPIYLPTGFTLAQYQAWLDPFLNEIDAAMNSKLVAADVTLPLVLTAGTTIKASPVANSLNERGGLLTFDTSGDWSDSVRIPGILTALMPGNDIAIGDAIISAIVTRLTTTTNSMRPVTRNSFNWLTLTGGKKSLRK